MKAGDKVTIKDSAMDWVHPTMRQQLMGVHTIREAITLGGTKVYFLENILGLSFLEDQLTKVPTSR